MRDKHGLKKRISKWNRSVFLNRGSKRVLQGFRKNWNKVGATWCDDWESGGPISGDRKNEQEIESFNKIWLFCSGDQKFD